MKWAAWLNNLRLDFKEWLGKITHCYSTLTKLYNEVSSIFQETNDYTVLKIPFTFWLNWQKTLKEQVGIQTQVSKNLFPIKTVKYIYALWIRSKLNHFTSYLFLGQNPIISLLIIFLFAYLTGCLFT